MAERKAKLKDRLKEALEKKNMRPVDLCTMTDIPKGAVSYYLAGKSEPKADRLYIMCKALDVSEAWLMGYDVPAARTPEQKKNDDLVKVVAQLRKDPEFYEVVSLLAQLPAEQYASVKTIVSALVQK
ncbi:MAG: helix-turn-helix domain-containing protein [Bacteroidales bacterium]|nr:helix-turn-helix domain-containing protein [Bacteroidales bacterium]